ncbi:MAG TPA: TlpA disulfide reductase family protein [Candidatus Acidoferrales bacterium]|nr:TlpA disulfide reductase family protein [Candidatus Acidoferrales bacterium]
MAVQPLALRLAGILTVLAFCGAAAVVAVHRAFREAPAQVGKPLPVLSLVDLDGAPASVRPQAGTTLYNVFATWCEPCAVETPLLASQAPLLGERGIRLVGIDQGDPPADVRAYIEHFGLNYPVFIDNHKTTNFLLEARVIPESVLVRNGIVENIYVGPLDRAALDHLVGVR